VSWGALLGVPMNRNSWTTPFGLAFLVGSVAALIAGYATGSGMRGGSELNMAVPSLNAAEPYVDENALIAANREPAAPVAPAPSVQAPAASPTQPPASSAETRQSGDDAASARAAELSMIDAAGSERRKR
jgi:hypothetical protein